VVAGRSVGSVGFVNLPKKAESLQVVPQSVTLVYEDQKSTVKTAEFGITIDGGDLKTNAKKARSWLHKFFGGDCSICVSQAAQINITK